MGKLGLCELEHTHIFLVMANFSSYFHQRNNDALHKVSFSRDISN